MAQTTSEEVVICLRTIFVVSMVGEKLEERRLEGTSSKHTMIRDLAVEKKELAL